MSVLFETVSTVYQLDQILVRVAENFVAALRNGLYNHALIMFSAFFLSWHLFAALFALADHTGVLSQYKIVKKDPVSWRSAMPTVLFNQLAILLPVMVAAAHFKIAFTNNTKVPFWLFPVHAYLLGAVHDIVFYLGHRFLHLKFMYSIHKKHHTSTGGCAAASLYMSPIDFFVEIILPYGVFLALVQTHVLFDTTLAVVGSLFAMYEHSGYCFSFWKAIDSRMHLSHHSGRYVGSLSEGVGSPGFMDQIFGTQLNDENYFQEESEKKQNINA